MSYIMKATLFFPTSGCSILSDEVRPNMFPPQQRHKKQTLPEKTENDTLNSLCRAAHSLRREHGCTQATAGKHEFNVYGLVHRTVHILDCLASKT